MNTAWRLTDNTHHRKYVEVLDPQFLPCITHVGWSRFLRADVPMASHKHAGCIEFCYISRGNPVFNIGNDEYPMSPNQLFITHPCDSHGTGKNPVDKMDLYWIGIRVHDEDTRFLGMNRYPEIALMQQKLMGLEKHVYPGSPVLGEYISKILCLFTSHDPLLRPMVSSLVVLFLNEVFDLSQSTDGIRVSPLIRKCMTFIDLHIGSELTIAELAESCDLTTSHFKHRFRNEVGIPPAEYILRRKVQRATEMLKSSEERITDIACDLGFSSSQYFATVYRRFTGNTPTQTRLHV